ncbi:chromosomal replication initiator protein DnaA [Deltaproteobacteria bacterium]|nr:chromosomal replication initiator protein DnaA [Deltaproteobacteria bacterium]
MNKESIRNHLRSSHTDAELQTWFDPLSLSFVDRETLEVRFPHLLFSRWFGEERQKKLEQEIGAFLGKSSQIVFIRSAKKRLESPNDGQTQNVTKSLSLLQNAEDISACTFANFIYNKKNEFPVSMAKEVATTARNPAYNPFILTGKGNCGKTHLMRAIAAEMAITIGIENIYFSNVEEMNALLLENKKPGVFKRRIARFKAVFLDNAQDLEKYHPLQQELVFISDSFKEKKKPFIIAMDGELDHTAFIPMLRSRLGSGLSVSLKSPDMDIRLRYVREQCATHRIHLEKEFLLPFAQRFSNLRTIQGIVTKIAAYQKKYGKPLTLPDLKKLVESYDTFSEKMATPDTIIGLVAEKFSLTPEELCGQNRRGNIVRARQIAMYLCRELLGVSLSSLGRYFQGKNHTTVLHAWKKIAQEMDSNNDIHKMVTQMRKKFFYSSG